MIVVGVDGSEGSRRALRWAFAEALLRRCGVEVITAWPSRGTSGHLSADEATEQRRKAAELQRHAIDGVRREVETPPATSCEVVRGDVIDVLVRASERADLLVVGSHGISSLRHAGLGSVSEACVRLAECPSVVVPAPLPPAWHARADVSTIVSMVDQPVTSFQASAVVTENGIADLWGRSYAEQARLLVAKAAHPAVRGDLRSEAEALGLLP